MMKVSLAIMLVSVITAITCHLIIASAYSRAAGKISNFGAPWRMWQFARSPEFVHPYRGLIVAGLFGSLIVLFASVFAVSIAGAMQKKMNAGTPTQSDKQ